MSEDDGAKPSGEPGPWWQPQPQPHRPPGRPQQPGEPQQPAQPEAPQYGQPQYGQQYAPPQYGQPQYGQQHGQPQYGQPQYGQQPYPGYGATQGQPNYWQPGYGEPVGKPVAGRANTVMILGIVSLVTFFGLCGLGIIAAIVSLAMAPGARREIEASRGALGGEGQLRAGAITSWITVGLTALGVVLVILFVAVAASSDPGGASY